MTKLAEIQKAIQRLPPAERSDLRDWYLEHEGFAPDIEEIWASEVRKRIEELDSGRVPGIPGEEVFARARKLLSR